MLVWTWQKFESWFYLLLSLLLLQEFPLPQICSALYHFLCSLFPALYREGCHKIAAFVFLTSFRESLTVWSLAIFAFAFTQRYVSDEKVARSLDETRASSHKTAPIADSKTQSLC